MTKDKEPAHVAAAKGSAREAIGKLIGDDAEAEAGRAEKDAAQSGKRGPSSRGAAKDD